MNIFYLDHDPNKAAKYMVDKHVVKMILESCQLMSTAHRVLDGFEYTYISDKNRKVKKFRLEDERENMLYQATHINHPSAQWIRESIENYFWLVDHTYALLDEYKYRYEKNHKCSSMMYMLQSPPLNLKEFDLTPIKLAMDTQYIISDDSVENYRNYYKQGKAHLFSWKKRQKPEWI